MIEGLAYDLIFSDNRTELFIIAIAIVSLLIFMVRLMFKLSDNAARQHQTESAVQSELLKIQQAHSNALHALTGAINAQTQHLAEQSQRLATALVDLIDKTDSTEQNILQPVAALTEQVRAIGDGVETMARTNNDNIDRLASRIQDINQNHTDAVLKLETHIDAKHNATHKSIGELLTELRNVRESVLQIHSESNTRFNDVMTSLAVVQGAVEQTIATSEHDAVSITRPIGTADLVANQPKDKKSNNDKEE